MDAAMPLPMEKLKGLIIISIISLLLIVIVMGLIKGFGG